MRQGATMAQMSELPLVPYTEVLNFNPNLTLRMDTVQGETPMGAQKVLGLLLRELLCGSPLAGILSLTP